MKIRAKLFNLAAFGILAVLLCAFQTSFLSHFSSFLNVSLWVMPLIYIVLYREFSTAIWFVYLAGFCASFFSVSSMGSIWVSLLVASSTLSYIKNKVFYDSSKYFFISCGLFVIFMCVGSWLLSLIGQSQHQISWTSYMFDAVVLMSLSFAFFKLFKKIDSWIPYDPLLEESKGELRI